MSAPYGALEAALAAGRELHAAHIIDLEMIQAMRRAIVRDKLDAPEGERRILVFRDLPIRRHSHVPHVLRIWSMRDNVKPYDAAYVALAETLDVPLWTRDARLARSTGHTARIEYIA